MQVLNFGKMEKINFLVLALLLFAFGNSKAQVINNKADSNRVCLFDVLGNKQYDANSEKISIVTALEETTQLIEAQKLTNVPLLLFIQFQIPTARET